MMYKEMLPDGTVRIWSFVMEFVPLHDIPYIFLSPDSQPYLSIDEFLASPDQYQNLSLCVPNALFP